MPYVQRNDAGKIMGVFANPQTDYAEEFIKDDAKELVAFYAARSQPSVYAQLAAIDLKRIRALSDVTLGDGDKKTKNGKTPREILTALEKDAAALRAQIK